MAKLTEPQFRALAFIRDFKITRSEWLKNGKPASGHPKTWTHMRWSGPEASLIVTADDKMALRQLVSVGPHPDHLGGSMYGLTEAGRAALAKNVEG